MRFFQILSRHVVATDSPGPNIHFTLVATVFEMENEADPQIYIGHDAFAEERVRALVVERPG